MAPLGYRELRESAAWLDLSGRGKIRMTGDDRARLLHAMTTNHIEGLKPGTGCYAYFLSAQGRILADAHVLCLPDALLLDTEPETREKVVQHLDKFIIADDVTLEDETETTATIALEGPGASQILRGLGAVGPNEENASVEWGQCLIARIAFTGGPGFFVFLPSGERADLIGELERAGAVAGSPEAFDVVRIENGQPRYGRDLSERFLAQEANQPQAVNFSKGCYLGQEIVERVRSRGQVHRLLMPLQIETVEIPAAGTKILDGTSSVAEITSAAYSPALEKVVALAYVRADKAKPGTELRLGDAAVLVRDRPL